jgi:formate-dependent nitrite reductase cytochrome c552 subunit
MKNLIKLFSLAIGAGFVLASCEGPMGPAGINGADGKDGKDANSSCLICHNSTNITAKESQFKVAAHYTGNPRTGKYCGRCHTNEGFQEITSKPWATGAFISVTNDMPNATRMACQTCHEHVSLDFAVDTIAQILRTTAPVSLAYDQYTKTTDFGPVNNLCVTCHQIRGVGNANSSLPFFPMDYTKLPTDTVQYRQSQGFSVHDGNQSNMFFGKNGYEYAGVTYTRTWQHSNNMCIDCHMNTYSAADTTGGHTFKPNKEVCTSCHSGEDKLTPVVTQISSKLTELGNLLVARKVFKSGYSAVNTHDYLGKLYDGTNTTIYTSLVANNTVSATSGLVVYGSKTTTAVDADYTNRILRPWKYGELGAAYNYTFVKAESPSGTNYGVHNPVYALQLLQNSIDWLNAHPATK